MAPAPGCSRTATRNNARGELTLRVALLSMLETADGGSIPCAFLRVGGQTVARQQLELALNLGCERVVCLAGAMSPQLAEIQHVAEAAGARFHTISGPRALVGLVTAGDEVVATADGLWPPIKIASDLLEAGQAVLVQPIETGLARGFERIDINHASGGLLRIPGRLVERIAELPSDCDTFSAIQRIALQAGTSQRLLPGTFPNGEDWLLVRSEDDAHRLEPRWIRQQTAGHDPFSPSRGIALIAVRRIGPALLHAGSGAGALLVAAAALVLLGLGAGWFGLAPLGFGFCALGWVLREATVVMSRIQGDVSPVWRRQFGNRAEFAVLVDAVFVALLGWAFPEEAGHAMLRGFLIPFVLVAMLRIIAATTSARWTSWLGDRAIVAVGLALLAGLAKSATALDIVVALVALAGMMIAGGLFRLTRS